MSSNPVNGETAAAISQFFFGGNGPSHSSLTRAFKAAGLSDADPYDSVAGTPNKQQRVIEVCSAAERRRDNAKKLMDGLLLALRMDKAFEDPYRRNEVATLRTALLHAGWALSDDGRLEQLGAVNLETGGREALNEQLARLQKNMDDPAVVLGISKELLEAAARFVLEENNRPADPRLPFPGLIDQSFEVLGFVKPVAQNDAPGAGHIADIYRGIRRIVTAVNSLRNEAGTGHGRTLPTGVSDAMARFVVREAALVTELMLATHDKMMGKS